MQLNPRSPTREPKISDRPSKSTGKIFVDLLSPKLGEEDRVKTRHSQKGSRYSGIVSSANFSI